MRNAVLQSLTVYRDRISQDDKMGINEECIDCGGRSSCFWWSQWLQPLMRQGNPVTLRTWFHPSLGFLLVLCQSLVHVQVCLHV